MKEKQCRRQDDVRLTVQTWERENQKVAALVRDYKEAGKQHRHNPEAYRPFLYRRILGVLQDMKIRFPAEKEL
jgi:hypothetical protein